MPRIKPLAAAIVMFGLLASAPAGAVTTLFFDSSQVATPVGSDISFDTISSDGYLFSYTRDKLFTGGVGMTDPIGRYVRVEWPDGLEAQAITTGPNTGIGARVTISRLDGEVFDLTGLSFKLLANTAGAGAELEVMPQLDGEDMRNDPVFLQASGYYGSSFSYSPTNLTGADTYEVKLYVDYALTSLTLVDASTPPPPIPEPSEWAMMLAGLGVVGVVARRKRQVR